MAILYVPYDGAIVTRAEAIAAGMKKYFTGKICSNGHLDQRFASTWSCVACQRTSSEKWFAENPERLREITSRWEKNNKQRRKETRAPHKEKLLQDGRDRYQRTKDQRKITVQIWKDNNPEIVRSIKINYRAKLLERGSHTGKDIADLFKIQKGKCANKWCRKDVSGGYHVDHVMPLALGGSNTKQNLQILCSECNLKKNAKHPIDFARQNGLLL